MPVTQERLRAPAESCHRLGGHQARISGAVLEVFVRFEQRLAVGILHVQAGSEAAAERQEPLAAQFGG
jgi:hypothetical protein